MVPEPFTGGSLALSDPNERSMNRLRALLTTRSNQRAGGKGFEEKSKLMTILDEMAGPLPIAELGGKERPNLALDPHQDKTQMLIGHVFQWLRERKTAEQVPEGNH